MRTGSTVPRPWAHGHLIWKLKAPRNASFENAFEVAVCEMSEAGLGIQKARRPFGRCRSLSKGVVALPALLDPGLRHCHAA